MIEELDLMLRLGLLTEYYVHNMWKIDFICENKIMQEIELDKKGTKYQSRTNKSERDAKAKLLRSQWHKEIRGGDYIAQGGGNHLLLNTKVIGIQIAIKDAVR